MAEHAPQRAESCAVCGRTILRGESTVAYLAPDGSERDVCSLCRERAEEAGWARADRAGARGASHRPRSRRRELRESLNGLRERLRGYAERARVVRLEREPEPEPESPPPPRPEPPPPRPEPPPPPDTPERRVRRAVERFNSSEQARLVAGLMRSLGEPQAAVQDASADPPRVEITVAWELSWYRWEVGLNGDEQVREVAKGAEVSELGGDEPDWNASVGGDGKLRWREGS